MNKKKALGLRLRELRKSRNYTQEKLAELIDVEPNTISNMECGRNYPNFATLEKTLKVLDSNFLEVFNFEHFDDNNVLKKKLIDFINKANEKELAFLYKTVVSLNEFKN